MAATPAPRAPARTANDAPAPQADDADSAPVLAERGMAGAATGAGPATPAPVPANGWGMQGPALGNDQAAAATLKLTGAPQQWQQPLAQALGDRLQLQLERNNEHAVIRLDPPMLGRIEISIRHAGGALQVNLSASNGDVVRQLHSIGDSLRHDLAQGQFADVSVAINTARSAAAQPFGDGQGRQRQPGREQEEQDPGRALSEAGQASSTFAMQTERE
jgi:flagellar hook-length control protein FliK